MAAEWSRFVFLGPSLPLDQAKAILPDAEFRPPIKRDDLTAIPAGSIVGIIDGLLAKSLAISPGEIRDAIDHGVHAYDAASMGALRAVASTRPSPTQLVHPEHQRLFRRIQIQPDDIADLVDELRIIADLEGVDQMGFEPERLPDPAHR